MNENNKIDFIDFLRREFGFKTAEKCQPTNAVLNIAMPTKKKSFAGEFKWLVPSQPKNLGRVLDIKIADEEDIDVNDEDDNNFDDKQANNWQQEIKNFKDSLPVVKKSFFDFKKFFVNIFAQPFSNVPGILSYCREEEPEEKQTPLAFKYLSLIIIVFITAAYSVVLFPKETKQLARFNEKIFIASWYKNEQSINKKNVAANANINTTDLANFIRTNANKIKPSSNSGQSFVLLSQDDILGRPAAAEEVSGNGAIENNDNLLIKIGNVEAEFIDQTAGLLYLLGEKQKNFSIYLGESLANVLGQ